MCGNMYLERSILTILWTPLEGLKGFRLLEKFAIIDRVDVGMKEYYIFLIIIMFCKYLQGRGNSFLPDNSKKVMYIRANVIPFDFCKL